MLPRSENPVPATLPWKPFQRQFDATTFRPPTGPLHAEWTFQRPEFERMFDATTL
jgi:hypothetical protein